MRDLMFLYFKFKARVITRSVIPTPWPVRLVSVGSFAKDTGRAGGPGPQLRDRTCQPPSEALCSG